MDEAVREEVYNRVVMVTLTSCDPLCVRWL